jgi:uncharacterized protein
MNENITNDNLEVVPGSKKEKMPDDIKLTAEKDTEEDTTEPESSVIEYLKGGIKEKKLSLKNDLIKLFSLKKIDKELFDIQEEKGDMPQDIEDIKHDIEQVLFETFELNKSNEDLSEEENTLTVENNLAEEKIYKYDEEKYSVKSNSEYDKIMQTIDALMETVKNNEERLKEIKLKKEENTAEIKKLEEELEELNKDLVENQESLEVLNKEHKEQEDLLNNQRNKLIKEIREELLTAYERINGTYHGEALAIVRKGNCSGCFNSVPPQREIEIKTCEDIFNCQSCGRILIDESLVEV